MTKFKVSLSFERPIAKNLSLWFKISFVLLLIELLCSITAGFMIVSTQKYQYHGTI